MQNGQIDWSIIGAGDGLSKWLPCEDCFEVHSPSSLIQLAGYAKFVCRANGPVYFRGQNVNHKKMIPALYRGSGSLVSFNNRRTDINAQIRGMVEKEAFMVSTPEYAYEPLMQHYGFNTKWLDLVDNIWTALWFACHEAHVTGAAKNYVHFERSREEFSYIFLFNIGWICKQSRPGLFSTKSGYLGIDLRVAVPSLYLRPHAQHGLLVCREKTKIFEDLDYSDRIVGTLKVKTTEALEWLGSNPLTQVHYMFPPPKYDPGYKLLLSKDISPVGATGCVQLIGA